jgi:AraC-like DNA-binding protein
VPRSTYYYPPRPESVENLRLLRRLDELYLDYPFFGSRRMAVIVAKPPGSADSLNEKKYKLKKAADIFGVSVWTVRRMFQNEAGIVFTGANPNSQRRAFVIPETVMIRVYRRRAA